MMSVKRWALSALVLPVLGSLVWFAIPRSSPRAVNAGAFEVAMVSPRGDTGSLNSIDVVFSETMIPLGGRIRGKEDPPLVLTPPIAGSFSWIGSRVLTFIPRGDVPTGTRITCRVPKGTRSLEGKETSTDTVWEIVVGRPRLLKSVPADKKMLAPDEPLYLLFNAAPAPGAADSIRLIAAGKRIPLARVAVDSLAVAELLPKDERRDGAARILALRPAAEVPSGQLCRLEIGAGIPFATSDVSMREAVAIEFETYGSPLPRSVSADLSGFDLALGGPVDPEVLRGHLRFDPPLTSFRVTPRDGNTARIEAGLRPGTPYKITVTAGLASLLGSATTVDAAVEADTPHRWGELTILPAGGYVPRTKSPAVRIQATNVDTVEVFGAWVDPDSVPGRITRGRGDQERPALRRIARWTEPRATPDSARATHIPVTRFGNPPARGQVLHVRVRAHVLFPDPKGQRNLLRDEAVIQITDLGLSAISGEESGIAWVTSLSTGKPVGAAEVLLRLPGIKVPLWSGKTDGEGLLRLPGFSQLSLPRGAPLVTEVRSGKDAAWLDLPTYRVESGWDDAARGVASHRAYAFTDRPLYRPGETVHWVAHVRRTGRGGILPASLPSCAYTITDPSGRQIESGSLDLVPPGQGSASFRLPSDAPLGEYNLQFRGADAPDRPSLHGTSFTVQEYRLPRFEARVHIPTAPAVSGSMTRAEGRFTYLGGGPLAGAPVRWTLSRHVDWSRPEGFWDFSFQDDRPRGMGGRGESGGPARVASGEGTLDSEGRIVLPITPDLSGQNEDQIYLLEMGARELADRSAYDVVSFPARRAAFRIGARARFDTEHPAGRPDSGGRERIELACMVFDSTDHPLSDIPLRWSIEKRSWKTVRVRRIGGVFGYENVPQDSLMATGTIRSTVDPAKIFWDPPSAGGYSFAVEGTDAQGRTTRARDMIYVSGPETASWYRDDGGWIELKPDKKEYAPTDTARVLIPAPAVPTEGLVLVLDDGIRSVTRLRRVEGSPRIGIPLAGSYPPGISVQAILIGPSVLPEGPEAKQRLPYHGWGSTGLTLKMDDWRLAVDVTADRTSYQPGDSVHVLIRVLDAQGRPAGGMVALAVVDDAVFELTGAGDPDPLSRFFEWRGSGVDYSDVRFRLQLAPTGEKGDLTPGGDGAGAGMGLRKRFTPTVHWDPAIPVGPDGRAVARFRLADDLTRYRFRALASSGVDRFGYGESKVDVRKPIMIEVAAPRFARDGDRIEVAAAVRSNLDRQVEVRLIAAADGARLEGKEERKLKVPAGGGGRAIFTLRDPQTAGIRLTLRAEGAGLQDAVEITVPIDRPVLWDREFFSGRAEPKLTTTVETAGGLSPEMGGLTTVLSPSMVGGLNDALDFTIDYPYGCLEQISSSLLGVVAKEAITRHLGENLETGRADRLAKVSAAILGIRHCSESWRLTSWPSPSSPDASDYTAGYALYVATRARESGLPFPRDLWNRLGEEVDDRLRNLTSISEEGDAGVVQRLLRDGPWLLWTLSEADRLLPPDSMRVRIDTAEALYARRSTAPLESRMILGLAMANLSRRPDAEALRRNWPNMAANLIRDLRSQSVQRTGRHVWVRSADPLWGDGIGGDVRMTALFLKLLAKVSPSDEEISGLVAWLLDHRMGRSGTWVNQHATALTLDLLVSTVASLEGPPSQVSVTIAIGPEFDSFRFLPGRNASSRRFTPISELIAPEGEKRVTPIRVEADGRRTVYLSASLDVAHPALDAPPREEGLIIDRTYVGRDGESLPGAIPLGEPLFVHLAVVVSRDAKTLMIEDPLPAGIEALNLSFQNSPRISMAGGLDEQEGEGRDGDSYGGGGEEDALEGGARGGRGDGTGLWIVHRELRDRSVRLFAEDVRAGVYHLYYPVIASTAGEFHTPGPRAELLYSPEIYAVGASQAVRIDKAR
jgi:alpha-2-macroglobulin